MTLHIYSEHGPILIFLALSIAISLILFALSYYLVGSYGYYTQTDAEKISTYECGFDPFDDARNRFDVRFYLVSILFIIFDLEVSFLFPWAMVLGDSTLDFGISAFWSMFVFLFLLTIGFVYEWMTGALDW